MAAGIEDYALLGDCETAALVCRDGSIDWLCWPRFDSAACFAALLGAPEHGRWRIAPAKEARSDRRYRGDTLILETDFHTDEGTVTIIDFMPPRGRSSDVVRIVVGRSGRVTMRSELVIRFDYGCTVPWVSRLEDGTLRAIAGPDMLVLRTPVALHGKDMTTVGTFTVEAGQRIPFVLTYGPSHGDLPAPIDPEAALEETEAFWQEWIGRCTNGGHWSEAVRRSLVTLKALTYRPTGGIVAAPTTSLPERLGGTRNWDYRFCWLRDSTFTLQALMNAGYYEEADAWRAWLVRAAAGSPDQLQIMYGIAGERRLTEWEASWLPGYQGAGPVRIGNAASGQLQIDIYGELMDAAYQGRCGGLGRDDTGLQFQQALLSHLEQVWDQPDEGIWEMRGGRRPFTFSKVMAWAAFDRAVKSVERFGMDGPVERWRELRDTIHRDVCANGYNDRIGSFVQAYGASEPDASLLLLPVIGFLPIDDPRIAGTIAMVERSLMRDGFVQRYDTHKVEDGLPTGEGAFLACSFWLVDCYVLQGRRSEAVALFERLLALRNDLGLLSEEYDPQSRRLVGNFPQAFSHIALVNSAHNLNRDAQPARQRSADGTADQAS
ncbi:glycoside hydrolase family 15 protein [Azospirillum picis]|uniref:GH15 family glucan-1,4-alpha-glucosidase n=1 Tax=Azospirillum picis TaxID=488438 RepID=A0ABU0MJA2_9PROT|nr:glycoside hydrolase family 15 protein [Azospirillum picis]MBP2299746.1 GH15 family glucan-1,4-alpha-glucosidase [Azospirillum picis]MDQ0533542.1 GH15 family glucan-1,4-alpha-glucosidase [Azospirillum picis]